MARIEIAFSEELGEELSAIEANERWIEGMLKDKRAFRCTGRECKAGLTCKSMCTTPQTRKQTPHYIHSSQHEEHSPVCDVWKEIVEQERTGQVNGRTTRKSGKNNIVRFYMYRPESHGKSTHTTNDNDKEIMNENVEGEKGGTRRKSDGHVDNYHWLLSLVSSYNKCKEEGTLDEGTVLLVFEKYGTIECKWNELFKRISNEFNENDGRKRYVYFGIGRVYSREDGGFDLVFKEHFRESKKKVKCVVKGEIIASYKYGKSQKVKLLEKSKGKDVFIYVLAKKNDKVEYSNIYLNVDSLDFIAVSDLDNI